jgi:hypothetical protein
MTSVFIGGSRAVSRLNKIIRDKLDDLISRRCVIFVGDANGADKAVQQHFASRGYEYVSVYCMEHCRNNLGNWPVKHVATPPDRTGFAYYAAKDLAMAHDAKCGMMLWDGKSKGTLNNIQQIINAGKQVLVYMAPQKAFHKVSTEQGLGDLLQRCDQGAIRQAQQQIRTKLPTTGQLPLHPPRA